MNIDDLFESLELSMRWNFIRKHIPQCTSAWTETTHATDKWKKKLYTIPNRQREKRTHYKSHWIRSAWTYKHIHKSQMPWKRRKKNQSVGVVDIVWHLCFCCGGISVAHPLIEQIETHKRHLKYWSCCFELWAHVRRERMQEGIEENHGW